MKTQTAKLNHLRISPRKARLVANMLKGLSANEAEAQLLISPQKSVGPILKLLRSAVSNSKQQQLNPENLFIKEIRVDGGPMLKRFMPRAQGRATMIQKKTSHITLVLGESEKPRTTRFKIVKSERILKSKARKIEKEKLKAIEKEKIKTQPKEGFIKRMFRRKSI